MSAQVVGAGPAVSGRRTAAEDLPVVEAVRTTGKGSSNEPIWVLRRCVFCKRRHSHVADVTATTMILPARCNPERFYRLREVSP